MKVLTVVGARPNFMKAAPIIWAVSKHNESAAADSGDRRDGPAETIHHLLVHTGQHYDELMSGSFFRDLGLPRPDVHLGVGSGSHAVQTGEIMRRFEEVLLRERPDVVVVVGDVNSTLACSLATAKVAFDPVGSRPLIAHVEAGLRSFDRSMPEEINRVLTDHICDLLFVTEESGLQNLSDEGVSASKIHFVGNTMIDSLLAFKAKAEASTILEELGLRDHTENSSARDSVHPYALLTLHRPANVDNREALLNILAGLEELAAECPIVFPVHPRTQRRIREFGLESQLLMVGGERKEERRDGGKTHHGIIATDPLGYLDFLCLMRHARLVVTDSGGMQEETTCLGIPCVTARENTERPVTVESGTNTIAGTTKEGIRDAIRRQTARQFAEVGPKQWDGHAATRIVDVLVRSNQERILSRPSLIAAMSEGATRAPKRPAAEGDEN